MHDDRNRSPLRGVEPQVEVALAAKGGAKSGFGAEVGGKVHVVPIAVGWHE